jgi:hypothetical protein
MATNSYIIKKGRHENFEVILQTIDYVKIDDCKFLVK